MYLSDTIAHRFTGLDLLPALIQSSLDGGNAITLWRMPRSREKHLLICTDGVQPLDEVSLEESVSGFVFSPFDRTKKKMFFRGRHILTFRDGEIDRAGVAEELLSKITATGRTPTNSIKRFPVQPFPADVPRNYEDLVAKSITAIAGGRFEKIVPSRTRDTTLPAEFDIVKSFHRLCDAYPDAMVSLVSSEETGTWLGATPELIVSLDEGGIFRTVALAGTQRYKQDMALKSVAWTEKEIEEQALVCRYIISCFKKIRVREYEEHGPRTAVAGNLLHLKTEYAVDTKAINFPQLASVMLNLLHPTSAVCGMPLEAALEFLKSHEGYDRQYYAGYLGPVNFRNESHVYVNLRCMQIFGEKARLYAGAGVTIDSHPRTEWEETELKFDTLLSIIN